LPWRKPPRNPVYTLQNLWDNLRLAFHIRQGGLWNEESSVPGRDSITAGDDPDQWSRTGVVPFRKEKGDEVARLDWWSVLLIDAEYRKCLSYLFK
jgi:hypothetical protein